MVMGKQMKPHAASIDTARHDTLDHNKVTSSSVYPLKPKPKPTFNIATPKRAGRRLPSAGGGSIQGSRIPKP